MPIARRMSYGHSVFLYQFVSTGHNLWCFELSCFNLNLPFMLLYLITFLFIFCCMTEFDFCWLSSIVIINIIIKNNRVTELHDIILILRIGLVDVLIYLYMGCICDN